MNEISEFKPKSTKVCSCANEIREMQSQECGNNVSLGVSLLMSSPDKKILERNVRSAQCFLRSLCGK